MACKILPKVIAPSTEQAAPLVPQVHLVKVDPETDPLLVQYIKEDERRQEIWMQPNGELRGVIVQIAEWFINNYRMDILARFQLAELINQLQKWSPFFRPPRRGECWGRS